MSAHRFNEEASWITEGIADVKEGTELLDKYQMGRVLGTGTFSTVRLARRKNDGALFAIKVRAHHRDHGGAKWSPLHRRPVLPPFTLTLRRWPTEPFVTNLATTPTAPPPTAMQVLEKFGISTGEQLRREILVLTEYRHPNVICLEEIYETETELYLGTSATCTCT